MKRAFTRIELLLVLAVVALLVGVRLPALGRVQTMSKIAQCAANLKADGMAVQMFATDNAGKLPLWGGGIWVWVLSRTTTTNLGGYGAQRAQMYDPGFPDQNIDQMWLASTSYAATGYAWCLSGTGATLARDDQNTSLLPSAISLTGDDPQLSPYADAQGLLKTDPSKRVLIADVNLSNPGQTDPNYVSTYQWTGINAGPLYGTKTSYGTWQGASTSHLTTAVPAGSSTSRPFPLGGNEAMLDGRVKWYPFEGMIYHTRGNSFPFWWQADPGKL